MTHRTNARPAGLGRAELIVLGGLSLLVVAVVMTWLSPKRESPAAPVLSTRPEVILEPLTTQESTLEVYVVPSSDAEKWDFGGGGNTTANWACFMGDGLDDHARRLAYGAGNPMSSRDGQE